MNSVMWHALVAVWGAALGGLSVLVLVGRWLTAAHRDVAYLDSAVVELDARLSTTQAALTSSVDASRALRSAYVKLLATVDADSAAELRSDIAMQETASLLRRVSGPATRPVTRARA